MSSSAQMKKNFDSFYESQNYNEEFEVRFGVKGKPISKIQLDNVIKYLLGQGFELGVETQTLKIQNEFIDPKTGKNKISSLRTEINGGLNIQEYCRSNIITNETGDVKPNVLFQQKQSMRNGDGEIIRHIDNTDFNFRISYQEEKKMNPSSGLVKQIVNDWNDRKKIFRLVTRYSLTSKDFTQRAFRIDISIVKSSKMNKNRNMIPTYNILDSNVFNNPETYEIEIEVDKSKMYGEKETLYGHLRKMIMYVLCGIQETNYPVGNSVQNKVKSEYFEMIHNKPLETNLYPKHFIGPSSISLETQNVAAVSEASNIPNIRNPYCVTEKADGERKLMFIDSVGKVYLINTNMNIQYTGCSTKQETHFNSMLDGEHIQFDKHGNHINMYAAFDIYFINSEDQRKKQFMDLLDETSIKQNYRLLQMQTFLKTLKLEKVSQNNNFKVSPKVFEIVLIDSNANFKKLEDGERVKKMNENTNIFKACRSILTKISSELFEYETDGLIFTPLNTTVGGDYKSDDVFNFKRTWGLSFKWKPPQYNTVDFLVTTKKDDTNKEVINTIFENGVSMESTDQVKQYKTLVLMVGFDERKHGYVNPCNDVIQDKIPDVVETFDKDTYKPMPFYPSNPSKDNAYLCNIMLSLDKTGQQQMYTEDGKQSFDDNTIVEFKYVQSNRDGWQWIPIRVRYDKTAEFRSGLKNYGNAYHVAQSVWSSIHNPITEEMLMSGLNIPSVDESDVYYNRVGKSQTKAMRDFHNLYVKKQLIYNVSSPGNTLYDLAVGKGGDFTKWIASKLRFVFGADVSKDNIENRLDGACARYLNYRKQFSRMPKALFVNADSSLHVRSGEACYSEKGKQIVQAVFGNGPRDEGLLGKGVYNQYGVGKEGFDIVSCQFALHYFFENKEKLHTFLRNVSEGCKVGGHFIGTCYDGKRVFNELRGVSQGDSVTEYKNGQKIWEIRKEYDHDEMKDDETSLGYAIDVYQETINKMFKEYLVNFDYLTRIMKNYGFELLSKEEAKKHKMPNSIGSFSELYDKMNTEIMHKKRRKSVNTKTEEEIGEAVNLVNNPGEQRISFLNNYFIYKKVNDVNAEGIYDMFLQEDKRVIEDEKKLESSLQTLIKKKPTIKKKKVVRLKKKLVLEE
jgi:hypothetical protein